VFSIFSYFMNINDNLKTITIKRFKQFCNYVLVIFITYISTIGLNSFYDWLMTLLPETLQYSETQNQMILEDMFENNWMLPFLFVDIVVLTPIIEQLLFRHLIIHELGKKITYGVASVLSVIL